MEHIHEDRYTPLGYIRGPYGKGRATPTVTATPSDKLVDGPEQVAPGPSDLDVGLIDVPTISYHVLAGPGGLSELRCEPLHPSVHGHVVDIDPALGQEFLHTR